jgi:hypothetical protein
MRYRFRHSKIYRWLSARLSRLLEEPQDGGTGSSLGPSRGQLAPGE